MWFLAWRRRTVLKSSGKTEEEVARKPEKKKMRFKPKGGADCWFEKRKI